MKCMALKITRDERGLTIDVNTDDWDHYEVIGMLEQAKWMVQREVDRMVRTKKEESE